MKVIQQDIEAKGLTEGILLDRNEWRRLIHVPDPAFPVPLSLDMIKRRLENNYYRTLEAVKHDASVMLSNAESYFGRNIEMRTKMRRLSEWIDDTFSSL